MFTTFRRTLRVKMLIVVVVSLLTGVAVYLVGTFGLEKYVSNVYMNSDNTSNRTAKKIQSFSAYVTTHSIKSTDTKALRTWQEQHENIYLLVYNKDNLVFDSDWVIEKRGSSKYVISNSGSGETIILLQDAYGTIRKIHREGAGGGKHDSGNTVKGGQSSGGNMLNTGAAEFDYTFYPVLFKDGVFDVCIVDYTDDTIKEVGNIAIFAISCILSAGIIIYYFGREISRMRRLTNEVMNIKDVDIRGPITIKGQDEIYLLAKNIDTMRVTIIEQLSREREAWQANSDLVTAMAHDIRTPLTVMAGYLDLMKNKEYSSQEELDEYIRISSEKAEQLRMMSDKMFRYFYVYSKGGDELKLEIFPAGDFLGQMIGEYVVLLGENGYEFNINMSDKEADICVDVQGMKRIMDNIFTNIRKYSDKSKAIDVRMQINRKNIYIYFRNYINPESSRAESTHIGTLTCKKMAEEMQGTFTAARKGRIYEAVLSLPNVTDESTQKNGLTAIISGGGMKLDETDDRA